MGIRIWIFILAVHATFGAVGQPSPVPRLPENGKNGYNASAPRSFIIEWDSIPEAAYYEYVVSDNNLCFAGCSGDTRQDQVAYRYGVETNLTLNQWYYWIVRAIMKNGDTTFYSQIQSFYTKPRPEDFRTYFTLSPNLVSDASMDIRIAWTIEPDIDYFNFKIFNSMGELLKTSGNISLEKSEVEQTETFSIGLQGFQPGLYFVEIKTNVSRIPERLKFLVGR